MTSTADIPCGNPQHQATKDLNLPCIGCDLDGRTLTLGELVAIDAAFLLHCPEGDDFGVAEEDERIEALGRLLGSMADEAAAAEAAKLLGLTAP